MRMFEYQQSQRYNVLAPWEGRDLRPAKTLVKTFQKPEYVVRNQDLSTREIRSILPPIGSSKELSMEQTRLLKESLGAILYSSRPEVIKRIRRSLNAADPLGQGRISNMRLVEILKENNVALDENTKKMLFVKFDTWQNSKCNYGEVMAFMAAALDDYRVQRDRSEFANLPRHTHAKKVRHPSMNSSEFILAPIAKRELPEDDDDDKYAGMPGTYSRMKLNNVFLEKRDAGLRLEVEKCFQDYRGQGDAYFMAVNLKKQLLDRDDDMISQYKLKGMVNRHQLPLNGALVDKLVERLDPLGSGRVSCTEFMNFLEKSLPLPKGYDGLGGAVKKQKPADVPPVRPKWETSKPLRAIKATQFDMGLTNSSNGSSTKQQNSKLFDRFMKLVAALRRRASDSESLPADDARETILKYNGMFSLGLSEADIDKALGNCEKNGMVEVDDIIEGLGILEGV
eukprot:gene7824-8673_t